MSEREMKLATREQFEELDACARRASRRVMRKAEELGIDAHVFLDVYVVIKRDDPEGALHGTHSNYAPVDLPVALRHLATNLAVHLGQEPRIQISRVERETLDALCKEVREDWGKLEDATPKAACAVHPDGCPVEHP